jgi:hypothetical protein
MRKHFIGSMCAALLFLTTQGAAQQIPGALPERTAPTPPQKKPPRPPPPTPTGSPYCVFDGKEFSIGAVLCVSSEMSQVCTAADDEHSRPWWSSGPQSNCTIARPQPPAPSSTLP